MKILYIHPAIRTYRVGIFDILAKKLNITFFWSTKACPLFNSNYHEYEEIQRILDDVDINSTQARELQNLNRQLSFDLLKLPFYGYNVYIFIYN